MLWEEIAEENNCTMDCTSNSKISSASQRACRVLPCSLAASARTEADDMIMDADELSFYGDNTAISQTRLPSPELLGLLSPEGSPQRFEIVQHEQKLQTKTVTPGRSFRVFNSLSSSGSMESSIDDEYMELFEMETLAGQQQHTFGFPSGLNSLISGQIKVSSPSQLMPINQSKTPETLTIMRRPPARRCLSMTESNQQMQQSPVPKTPEQLLKETARDCFKRPEPPASTNCSPVQSKRHRFAEKENCPAPQTVPVVSSTHLHPPALRKCISLNDAEIASALARSENRNEPELIGDFSKAYCLPLIEGRHRDLKSISSNTVSRLLRGEFNEQVASYRIIDCRYPYEFEGGHIAGAKNLYTHEQVLEEFLTTQQTELQQQNNATAGQKRHIIIFHCEFSSERGPKMSRFLRNLDRERNTSAYPALHYPEIYLLHNGYKDFYETHAELCEPHAYRPMLEPAFNEAYRHFRAKSKSWNGDGLGGATGRLKKSRSRLLL